MLAEMILKDEQLITTVFKARVYTEIARASVPKVPGRFFSYLIFVEYLCYGDSTF